MVKFGDEYKFKVYKVNEPENFIDSAGKILDKPYEFEASGKQTSAMALSLDRKYLATGFSSDSNYVFIHDKIYVIKTKLTIDRVNKFHVIGSPITRLTEQELGSAFNLLEESVSTTEESEVTGENWLPKAWAEKISEE
ncbi:MAG: hypothetical protein AAF502_11405 [Bacteroidota bacterium]